jgi:DNA polymerase-3 subunit epsilon
VRRLTGFDEEHVQHALRPEEAWRRLRESMRAAGPMPTAIHFARFELSFLREWASRFEPVGVFPIDAVCVHALACRLYPELPRQTLRALAGYLGHGLHLERRSLGHVEATAFIWRKLVPELARRGVHTWERLREFMASPAESARPRSKQRRFPLPSARHKSLPDAPGVYRFLRSNGDLLYVGKATSLRKRVGSHFTLRAKTGLALEMLTQVNDIDFTLTPTPLEAALLENETIKALGPQYNVQLVARATEPSWFASRDFSEATSVPDDDHPIGPLPSEYSVSALGALLLLLSGEPATDTLRARAVVTAERWAPDTPVFAAGLRQFRERYPMLAEERLASSTRVRRELLRAADSVLRALKAAGKADEEPEPESADAATSSPWTWDEARVVRHLERGVSQGYQLFRRAAWLAMVVDSVVVYREASSEEPRRLVWRDGELVDARYALGDAAPGELPEVPRKRLLRERLGAFDRAKYDRLRILTTELKRVRSEGGDVTVYIGPKRQLSGALLDSIFRSI